MSLVVPFVLKRNTISLNKTLHLNGNYTEYISTTWNFVSGYASSSTVPLPVMNSLDDFSLQTMCELFSTSKSESDEGLVFLDDYIHAFEELSKLFKLFGTVFGFVSSDVIDKIGILRDYRKSPEAENYKTIQSMIQYEVDNNIADNKKKASGSRTLLRLHRAMEFTAQIMIDIKDSDEKGKMSTITSHSYDKTLAKHHPWLIRKAVHLAVYTLPKRQHLLEKMKLHDEEEAKQDLGKAVNIQRELFDIIEEIYKKNNLLDLP